LTKFKEKKEQQTVGNYYFFSGHTHCPQSEIDILFSVSLSLQSKQILLYIEKPGEMTRVINP
jgi:hypothetical protein